MKNFIGDLSWVHEREGHVGEPYWPGGMSGVTIDPGVDLGHADRSLLLDNYYDLMTSEQLNEAFSLKGITGQRAAEALSQLSYLSSFKITREEASRIFPSITTPYWNGLLKRWPALAEAPSSVQTAMLSVSFNRGYNNSKLESLTEFISRKDWMKLGESIKEMQQDHSLDGIRKRRQLESELILNDIPLS